MKGQQGLKVTEEMKKSILMTLTTPLCLTDLSKKLHKDKSNVKKYIKSLQSYVKEKEEINHSGKVKVLSLRKKGLSYLGIDTKLKPNRKKVVTTTKLREHYLNENELELLQQNGGQDILRYEEEFC